MDVKKVLKEDLPLQTETNVFILLNVLDVYMTYVLLRRGAMEANPFANYVLENWGFNAMVWFKLIIVTLVCIIAQLIATRTHPTARFLLIGGSVVVGGVVIYSIALFFRHFL